MADITTCTNEECKKKDTCYRYNAVANKYMQSYFMNAKIDCEKNGCEMYWKISAK